MALANLTRFQEFFALIDCESMLWLAVDKLRENIYPVQ